MTVVLFTGPTLSAADARAELDAICLPPASEGDVYRVALERPRVIGIIDGYFESVPAVWHKEILAAMADGIHVFGSASIGALRAAELAAFGMEGVGSVFESFRDGRLQDDDEVAVMHGPDETGYVALSDAMVNIRATLEQAAASGVLSAAIASQLSAIAKRMHYKERRYDSLLRVAQTAGLSPNELSALRDWLPEGRVDLKRLDALEMLRVIRRRLADALPPKKVAFRFEHTRFWEECSRAAAARGRIERTGEDSAAAVAEEAKLALRAYRRATKPALARYLALKEARRLDKRATAAEVQETAERFRRERGLEDARSLRRWLDENELDDAAFADLLSQEALVAWIDKIVGSTRRRELLNELRLSGDYARLARRARDKERRLSAIGAERSVADLHGLTESDLLGWFARHRGVAGDSLVDLAARLGFSDIAELRRALLRERLYAACLESAASATELPAAASPDDALVRPGRSLAPETSRRRCI
jgi:hypothetical protein